jgi:hypothetical protein
MLGLPVIEWVRFFACAFGAGVLLFLIPYGPMSIIAVFEMAAAAAGLVLVAIYARCYEPWAWRRLLVQTRRLRYAVAHVLRATPSRRVFLSSAESSVVIAARGCKAFTQDESERLLTH